MVNFKTEEILSTMKKVKNIRNMCVIAHVDHGKSTLTDCLISKSGLISQTKTGDRFTDDRDDEKELGITIKSTAVAMHFEIDPEDLVEVNHRQREQLDKWIDQDQKEEESQEKKEAEIKYEGDEDKSEDEDVNEKKEKEKEKEKVNEMKEKAKETDTENGFLVNLIDCPGHIDFSSEVTAALRLTDGAIVVVDCVEGVCVQTETVLRQALMERIRPVLVINKIDRALLELNLDKETLYQSFQRVIENVNVIISTNSDQKMSGINQVDPQIGNVSFTSGLHGWGFTLYQFAKKYSKKFGVDKNKLLKKLWGDHFFNLETKKWSKMNKKNEGMNYPKNEGEEKKDCNEKSCEKIERSFNHFILEPIYEIFSTVMKASTLGIKDEKVMRLLNKLDIVIKNGEEKEESGKKLLKSIMRQFLPAGDALVEMIVIHLPSPLIAQRYRVDHLYEGPLNDECAEGIRNCDINSPLMVYVSKMLPSSEKGRFIALARVFSGVITNKKRVRIQGPHFNQGKKDDLYFKNIQRLVILTGKYTQGIEECPCGNIVGILGVDQFILKSGTITSSEVAHNLKVMKFSVSPIVQVAVEPRNSSDLPKLVEGLKSLSRSDPLCLTYTSESGEHIISCSGELHIKISLKDLERDHAQIPIKISDPIVNFRETVTKPSEIVCLSKSPNKHNRIYMKAQPLQEDLTISIESGVLFNPSTPSNLQQQLTNNFGWDITQTKKVWCFGPERTGPNILVDMTKAVQYLNEVKDSCVSSFQWVTKEGVLCEESMRGCRFNIMDMSLHSDSIHRGAGQIIPTLRRVVYASYLTAEPTLMEPVYLAQIYCPSDLVGVVHSVLSKRRAHVIFQDHSIHHSSSPLCHISAHLPVLESFGFNEDLRSNTSGQAFPQLIFDHWQPIQGSINLPGKLQDLVIATRKRKGLSTQIPSLDHFYDKL